MRVLNLATGADTAGISAATAFAFRRHAPGWDVRSMVASQNYIQYPVDVPYSVRERDRLYDAADVVHLHNSLAGHTFYDAGRGKPTVLHHHGMKNGSDRPFSQMVRDAREVGAVQVASTLDLAIREPGLVWVGAPADLPALRAIRRREYRPSTRIRIGHAPTNRDIKGTEAFLAAIGRLAETVPVEPVLIERTTWTECLRRKAAVDIFFDQPVLGYGSNAIEAWAMGIPVIAGVADPLIRAGMLERWGVLPFYEATEDTLLDALRLLVLDDDLREEYAARGTRHVERWHDERVAVETLSGLYAGAGATVPAVAPRGRVPLRLRRPVVVGGRVRPLGRDLGVPL